MANLLGLYFGPKVISITEAKAKKIVNSVNIQRSILSASELEEKVPDDVKMVALFKEELRRNQISAKEVSISLSGHDLITRTFEIPVIPENELPSIINFEVKKYIPFKVEELVSDFQVHLDKASHRNQVLYVGIKKEVLEKYLSIIGQLGIKVTNIEYSAFSILRFLKLTNFNNRGMVGVISMDLVEEDEVNFSILENGFPLFSRDITLSGGPEEATAAAAAGAGGSILEKLKTEIRVSLDYYHRKFSFKKIAKTFIIANEQYHAELEAFFKEVGLTPQFIDIAKYLGRQQKMSLGLIKSYGASLDNTVKTDLKIDILASKARAKIQKEPGFRLEPLAFLEGVQINPRSVLAALFLCGLAFGLIMYRKLPVQNEINTVIASRPKVDKSINPESTYEELKKIDEEYIKRINVANDLIMKQMYVTEALDVIPRVLPSEIRLTNLNYRKRGDKGSELVMQGVAYLGDGDQELKLINSFVSTLKENQMLKKYFKDIILTSMEQKKQETSSYTNFTITFK